MLFIWRPQRERTLREVLVLVHRFIADKARQMLKIGQRESDRGGPVCRRAAHRPQRDRGDSRLNPLGGSPEIGRRERKVDVIDREVHAIVGQPPRDGEAIRTAGDEDPTQLRQRAPVGQLDEQREKPFVANVFQTVDHERQLGHRSDVAGSPRGNFTRRFVRSVHVLARAQK